MNTPDIIYEILLKTDDSTLKRFCSITNKSIQQICSSTRFWQERLRYFFGDKAVSLKYPEVSYREWYFLLSEDIIGDLLNLEGEDRVIRKYTERYVTKGSQKFQNKVKLLIKAIQQNDAELIDYFMELSKIDHLDVEQIDLLKAIIKSNNVDLANYFINTDTYPLYAEILSFVFGFTDSIDQNIDFLVNEDTIQDDQLIKKLYHHLTIDQELLGLAIYYKKNWLIQRILEENVLDQAEIAQAALYGGNLELAGDYETILSPTDIFINLLRGNPELALEYSAGQQIATYDDYEEDVLSVADLHDVKIRTAATLAKYIARFGQEYLDRFIDIDCNNLPEIVKMLGLLDDHYARVSIYRRLLFVGCYDIMKIILNDTTLSKDDAINLLYSLQYRGYIDLEQAIKTKFDL